MSSLLTDQNEHTNSCQSCAYWISRNALATYQAKTVSICGQVSRYKKHSEGCVRCLAMSKLFAAQQISYYIQFIETDLLVEN